MSEYLKDLMKQTGNEYAGLVSEGIEAGDVDKFIDTGSYVLNGLLSGSIYGGLPANKITAFAGESATGKTFFVLGVARAFLDSDPSAGVIYFESESALTTQMITDRGIDVNRMVVVPVATIQEFTHQALKVLERHYEQGCNQPLMLCLDSLGMLSTSKEVGDISEGKETKDMTRAQITKGAFRVLTLKLGKTKVPLLVTNHTYKQVGTMFPQDVMGGGMGLYYAASSILFLSRRKEKDGTEVIGNVIHCKNHKSRLTKENKKVDVLLTYDKGLSKYYGLLDLSEKYGIIKKVSTRYELPDGAKLFGKQIMADPEKHFTQEVLDKIEERVNKEFRYGFINEEGDEDGNGES
tara:strand:+ start:1287 stop:2336 length:1050 start_codon:yes stop_codon:yes gene_type:complete